MPSRRPPTPRTAPPADEGPASRPTRGGSASPARRCRAAATPPRRLALQRLAVPLLACVPGAWANPPPAGAPVRWPTVRLLDGRSWSAAQAQGQVVVVVFFSTTCPYCLRHNRRVTALAEATAGRGLVVLGVAHDPDPGLVARHMARHGHRFEVTVDSAPMHAVLSPRRVVPLTCVVDRGGLLREVIPGEMSDEDVQGLARWLHR